MPVTLPGPGDFAALPWHKRDKAIMAARALLRAYGATVSSDMTGDGYRPAREVSRRADKAWGERVRAEARALAGEGS